MKNCSKCKQIKEFIEFYSNKSTKTGYSAWCKHCSKEYRQKPEIILYQKEYTKKYGPIYNQTHKRKNTQEIQRIKRKYGITLEQKEIMFNNQFGKCAICLKKFDNVKAACVDHNHSNGKIRDLLCKPCNAYLGKIEKDEQVLINLSCYVEKHRAS